MKYVRLLLFGALAAVAGFFALRAHRERGRAQQAYEADERELEEAIINGTAEARAAALRAKEHIAKARAAEDRAERILGKGAGNEPIADILDRWRARSRRDRMRADTDAG